MKGIYLSEEGKKEIEAMIVKLEKQLEEPAHFPSVLSGKLLCLKEILSSATILPVETDMNYIKSQDFGYEFDIEYPNGVIIQPKQ